MKLNLATWRQKQKPKPENSYCIKAALKPYNKFFALTAQKSTCYDT